MNVWNGLVGLFGLLALLLAGVFAYRRNGSRKQHHGAAGRGAEQEPAWRSSLTEPDTQAGRI